MDINIVTITISFLLVIIFGYLTIKSDIKEGKIRNNHILSFLIIGLMVFISISIISAVNQTLNVSFVIETISNLLLATIVGYLFWVFGIWAPADGKLFTVYSILIPLSIYKIGHVNLFSFVNFSSINILINTFVLAFIFLFLNLLWKSTIKQKKDALSKAFSPKVILFVLLSLFSYLWIVELFFKLFGLTPSYLFSYLVVLLLFLFTEKIFMVSSRKFIIAISILRLFFDQGWRSMDFFLDLILLLVLFLIFRFFTLELGFETFTKEVSVKKLKPGMILADVIYRDNKKVRKRKALYFSIFNYLSNQQDTVIDSKSEGITQKDILRIKGLQKKNPEFETIRVHEHLPFAVIMFIGVLLTFLVSGNFILFLFG